MNKDIFEHDNQAEHNSSPKNEPLKIRRVNIPDTTDEELSTSQNNSEPNFASQPKPFAKVDLPDDMLSENSSEKNSASESSKTIADVSSVDNNVVTENLENTLETLETNLVRSNRNVSNDDTIVKEQAIRFDTKSLKQYLKPKAEFKNSETSNNDQAKQPWIIDKENGAKVYELVGYTTTSKIQHKFKNEQRQTLLKRVLITLLLIIIFFLAIYIINPIKSFNDFKRIVGIKSMYGNQEAGNTIQTVEDQNSQQTSEENTPESTDETSEQPE